MKVLPVLLIALAAVASSWYFSSKIDQKRPVPLSTVQLYAKWRAQHGKLYASPAESDFRLSVFAERLQMLELANAEYEEQVRQNGDAPLSGPMFALQSFSDLTPEEFKSKFTGLKLDQALGTEAEELDLSTEPTALAASPDSSLGQTAFKIKVRDQGACGSCWAFSTVATAEKKYFDQAKTQLDLSQQELVDCSTQDDGCDGGWPYTTYSYLKKYGIATAAGYPYNGNTNRCRRSNVNRVAFDATMAPRQHPFTVATAKRVTDSGIIAGICVYSMGKFSHVSSTDDVYNANYGKECGQSVDHAINLTGAGADYVVLLNSWGPGWGNRGFKKVKPCDANANLLGKPSLVSHISANFK